jgi:hypothetical protein
MENVTFLQKPLDLARSSQETIAKIRSVAAEISRYYVPISTNFSPFFNILFSFIYQQILFNQTINRLTLTRFDVNFPYNLWADQPRQLEEETLAEIEQPNTTYLPNFLIAKKLKTNLIADYSALTTAKSNVSFLSNLLLAKNIASNFGAPIVEQPSIHVPTPKPTYFLGTVESQGVDSTTKIVTPSFPEPQVKKAARLEEEYLSPSRGLSKVWFLPSFLLAKKITFDLIKTLAAQPSQAELSQNLPPLLISETKESLVKNRKLTEPFLPPEVAPLPKTVSAERVAKKEKTPEEIPEISHVNQMIKWQSDLASKISPSTKSIAAFAQYEEPVIPIASSVATFETATSGFTGLRALEVPPSAALPSEKTDDEDLIFEHPSITRVSKEPQPLEQKKDVGIEEEYLSPSRGLSKVWFLPSFLFAQKVASKLIVALAEQPSQVAPSKEATLSFKSETLASLVQKENQIEPAFSQKEARLQKTKTTEKASVVSKKEEAPSELTVSTKLTSKSLSPFEFATILPALILEKQNPFLKIAAALSQASSLPTVTPGPRTEQPYSFPMEAAQTIQPLGSGQMNFLAKEIAPSLTSWIYEGSELLRPTGVALSAVPIAASLAEKIVAETLIQPMSTFTTTPPYDYGKPITSEGAEKPSRLPTVLALAGAGSLITHRLQHELVALSMENKTIRKPFSQISTGASGQVTPVRTLGTTAISEIAKEIATGLYAAAIAVPASRAVAEAQTSEAALIAGSVAAVSYLTSGLASGASYKVVAAQASRAALIAGSAAATAELSARLMGVYYLEAAAETSSKAFARATAKASQAAAIALVSSNATAISELASGASAEADAETSAVSGARIAFGDALTQSRQPERPIQSSLPVSPKPSKPLSIAPIIQNSLNSITEEASEEEDLRDLERKIKKILSEQISRYYGSSMI